MNTHNVHFHEEMRKMVVQPMARHCQIPTLCANVAYTCSVTDKVKNNIALAHLYHVRKSYSKYGQIPSSGLGGDSMTDRQTHRQTEAFTIFPSLYKA